ncbi:30S ribosomal protein S28e [Candidatus Micrarchaeota archaeon]|nr:30S ribosomal protein S28e [Candidatus Micrarchaeota archaeon]
MAEDNEGTKAEVVQVESKKTGIHGEINQILCKILEGKDKNRILRRNIKGPVKVGDIMILLETEREAKRIKPK